MFVRKRLVKSFFDVSYLLLKWDKSKKIYKISILQLTCIFKNVNYIVLRASVAQTIAPQASVQDD